MPLTVTGPHKRRRMQLVFARISNLFKTNKRNQRLVRTEAELSCVFTERWREPNVDSYSTGSSVQCPIVGSSVLKHSLEPPPMIHRRKLDQNHLVVAAIDRRACLVDLHNISRTTNRALSKFLMQSRVNYGCALSDRLAIVPSNKDLLALISSVR